MRPTLIREPSGHHWEQLEDELEPVVKVLPAGTDLLAVLDPLPAVAEWRERFDLER